MSDYISTDSLRQICGDGPTMQLLSAKGGTRIYVPGRLTDDHWLIGLVGLEAAQALVKHLTSDGNGCKVELPLGQHGQFGQYRRRLVAAVAEGASDNDVARRVGVTGRTVRRERQRQRTAPDPNQKDLF